MAMTLREPIGVVGLITPWNFPLLIASQKVPYALAAGCSIVLKPSELTSATTLLLGEVLKDCGLPDGVFNVVTGYGDPVGQRLCELDLQPDIVSAWLSELHEARSAIPVNKNRRELLILWNHAYANAVIEQDSRRVRRFKQLQIIPVAWTADELSRLVEACYSLDGYFTNGIRRAAFWELLIRLAYDTGLRRGDLLSLHFDQLRDDGQIVLHQRKTGWIHICGPLRIETVEILHATLPPERELLCPFTSGWSVFYDWWHRIRDAAGVSKDGALHKIRKTAASYVERDHPGTAMVFLGHRTPGVAYRHYVDPTIATSNTPLL